MSLAIDVLEPSALLIVCQVLDGALLTRLRGVKPGIGSAANVRFCLDGCKEKSTGQTGDSCHHNVAGEAKICPALLTWFSPKNCHVFTLQNCQETSIFELQCRVFGSELIALLGQLNDFFP